MFVPKNFVPPVLKTELYIARKLSAKDVYLDYMAVMSSIDVIKKVRGGSWPTQELTFEDDLIDLCWHQREFEFNSSFAYTVMNLDETECLGCIYFYPPRSGMNSASSTDSTHEAEISWWVTTKAYEQGLYEKLSNDIKKWVEESWPMKNVKYTNEVLPQDFN